ncbi:peptide-methionine (S)-S-oxide reductase [Seonamhaeicola sp. ML3]|uniref:peptide-methionine (S)-S-oxide reductase n=1 Tax=Seonamhaeicola sp. ML3 TaxID=2937786 RepID=UPI00200BB05D|nr:peptide-methionine (S)-S-oxide reductase [Seonamhaeicola sp. ML3]
MILTEKIAFGGGCHWCTEAVFQSLVGVDKVEQGFVASTAENCTFSEAVIVHFDKFQIPLKALLEIHLHTHKSTSNHSFREKYRSAVYTFSETQHNEVKALLEDLQIQFQNKLITKVLPFREFKASRVQIQNYYFKNPNKPFCKTFINPKLRVLMDKFSEYTNKQQLKHVNNETREITYSK